MHGKMLLRGGVSIHLLSLHSYAARCLQLQHFPSDCYTRAKQSLSLSQGNRAGTSRHAASQLLRLVVSCLKLLKTWIELTKSSSFEERDALKHFPSALPMVSLCRSLRRRVQGLFLGALRSGIVICFYLRQFGFPLFSFQLNS